MPANLRVSLKRVYESPSESDGTRVLVDRLWPRGLKKADARIDAWFRDVAPSNELRKWFHAHPEERQEFRKRYLQELHGAEAGAALKQLRELLARADRVTMLFASKNAEYNNAVVLRDLMAGAGKPPARTEPVARGLGARRRRPRV